ncbi:uncharacterized protein LOC111537775 [Piliocolobus tephrosceles]|uniref:uncharacterized protein LOC111537775 n=1 Tax=Piliocolobus tephrosceles TaxID=591936 RepID=UPI000C2A4B1D|nr:uncharacterized protein LOC111537775 [Piliocolobus tephrosceles]
MQPLPLGPWEPCSTGTAPGGSTLARPAASQSWTRPGPFWPRTVQTPEVAGRAGGLERWRRGGLPAVISLRRLRLRQPLITSLLMRPAAVCNHPGPRCAAREAAGESARGGVEEEQPPPPGPGDALDDDRGVPRPCPPPECWPRRGSGGGSHPNPSSVLSRAGPQSHYPPRRTGEEADEALRGEFTQVHNRAQSTSV